MATPNFDDLRKKLDETQTYPTVYMFKFIMGAEHRKIALIEKTYSARMQKFTPKKVIKENTSASPLRKS